jgi:gliding motility-associatede transport system auxiliary component
MQKKSFETILYSTVGVVAMALILIAINVLGGAVRERLDLTKEKAYTLSKGTHAILAELDTPVTIRFYCTRSGGTSPQAVYLKNYAREVEDLLMEYKRAAKGKIILKKFDPEPDSDAEDSARLDGLQGVPLPSGDQFYLGLAVEMVGAKEVLPFLAPNEERLLEYNISRCISRVMKPEKPVIGVMSPLPVFGMPSNPMMAQMGRGGQDPWTFITELQRDYTVKPVEMTADKIDDDIKELVVIHPKDISDAAQYAIDQFILRGGKLIAFLDASSLVDSQQQNAMMGRMPGGGSSLPKLLKAWGVKFDNSKVVADMNFKMEVGNGATPREEPTWLAITPEGIQTNDIVTSEIDNIWYFSGGSFSGTPADGLKETVLLKSTSNSQLVDGFLANLSGDSIMKDFKPSGKAYDLAIRLTGKFKTAFPDGKPAEKKDDEKKSAEKKEDKTAEKKADNSLKVSKVPTSVILVGDADMLNDNFTVRRVQTPFGTLATPMNGNLTFAENAVEQMSGDNNLIAVRSRATMSHPFTRVKEMEAAARMRYQDELSKLEKNKAEAQQRIDELQSQKKDKSQRFIMSQEQEQELARFQKEVAQTDKKLRQVQKDLRREVDSLETRVEWVNIAAMPLAVTLCGIILAMYKRKLTAAK